MIANLGEAARADSFHNRCSGSQIEIGPKKSYFPVCNDTLLVIARLEQKFGGCDQFDYGRHSFSPVSSFGVWPHNRLSRVTENHKLGKAVVFTRLATH